MENKYVRKNTTFISVYIHTLVYYNVLSASIVSFSSLWLARLVNVAHLTALATRMR